MDLLKVYRNLGGYLADVAIGILNNEAVTQGLPQTDWLSACSSPAGSDVGFGYSIDPGLTVVF